MTCGVDHILIHSLVAIDLKCQNNVIKVEYAAINVNFTFKDITTNVDLNPIFYWKNLLEKLRV